ncbi:MAG: DUF6572 domain-containing protein [Candidatus Eiseniibacteriota bacterium]
MSRFSRDDMIREFGEPGVQNPRVVDLIRPDRGRVHLVMVEHRPWTSEEQLRQLEEKINRYLGYVLDGYFLDHYSEYRGVPVVLELECVQTPHGEVVEFLEEATRAVEEVGLRFQVRVLDAPAA